MRKDEDWKSGHDIKKRVNMDRMTVPFEHIMKYLGSRKEKGRKRIGLLVDGPNMLRKEFQMDLEEIRDILKDYGDIKMGKVFLNQ
ncbi:MAG: hypothetical protein WCZ26_10040, partial [Methanothrix soehngenii]